MRRLLALWPIITFALVTAVDEAGIQLGIPHGTLTIIGEVGLSVWIALQIKSRVEGRLKWLLVAPLGFALGDLAYGLNHYVFQYIYKSSLGPMSYAIPYLVAMAATIYWLVMLCREQGESKKIFLIANVISAALFFLNVTLIVVPSLFHKSPPLSTPIAALTVAFSTLESVIVGFSATLLLISTSGMLQIALFGLLIMNMSDIAMRYQSVYQNISGMIVFEHGWFFGLALVASGVLLAARSTNAEVRSKLRQVLCFYSIRSMTIGFVLLGLGLIWLALGTYFRAIHLPNEVSASLLIAVSVFAFAVLAANVVSQNLSQIVFRLASNKSVSRQDFPKHLPEEIRTIVEYFQMLSGKLTGERDHALKLSSTIAHNIKSPAGALEMARFKINRHINKGCECCKQLQEPLRLIGVSAEAIKNISDRILEEKKRLIALETVADSVSNAVAITTANHPDHQIFIEVAPESQLVPVIGLSEILTNLIDNAVEASLPTQPIIVRTRLEGTGMTVMVVDHGCGIPDWMLAELKKGEERTSKGRGNGIGVSSMYAWAKERGYEITIDSSTATPATGTRVAISIPASLSPEVLEPTVTTQENVAIWT